MVDCIRIRVYLFQLFAVFVISSFVKEVKDRYFNNFTARSNEASKIFKKASGVYKNSTMSTELNLAQTIFSTVISFNRQGNFHYKVYFLNFLCFIKHHNLKLIVYILHHYSENVEQELKYFSNLSDNLSVITFPGELYRSYPLGFLFYD